jgi:hypothetical protein
MITCQNAKHLFSRYLDGDLSPSMQAELHAHQLQCSECQGELALLEACGDVIAYDHSEPTISASFTDRVLLAHQAQAKPVVRRNWSRVILTIASPLAAAACIAFAVLLIGPTSKEGRLTVVAGEGAKVSKATAVALTGGKDVLQSNMPTIEEMPAGFVDAILGPIVEQTKGTVDSTKRSIEQLDSLVRLGFAGANDALAAGLRTPAADRTAVDSARQSRMAEPNPLDPSFLRETPTTPELGSEVDETIEAL